MEGTGKSLRRTGQLGVIALALYSTGCTATSTEACEGLPGTSQEVAATPRLDANLELLALRLSDGVAADEAVYQRLVRDITAIRAQAPAVEGVRYFAPYSDALYIALDDPSYKQFQAGKYRAWERVNRHYGVTDMSPSTMNSVTLIFEGRFNLDKLASAYKKVGGVRFAEPVRTLGDGPTIYVTEDADTWHYVFDNASGACPAGCTEHDAYYFVVGRDGKPAFVGRWESARNAGPRPDWIDRYMEPKS